MLYLVNDYSILIFRIILKPGIKHTNKISESCPKTFRYVPLKIKLKLYNDIFRY